MHWYFIAGPAMLGIFLLVLSPVTAILAPLIRDFGLPFMPIANFVYVLLTPSSSSGYIPLLPWFVIWMAGAIYCGADLVPGSQNERANQYRQLSAQCAQLTRLSTDLPEETLRREAIDIYLRITALEEKRK